MLTEISCRVCGIPAKLLVEASYTRPNWTADTAEEWYGGWGADFEVCDRRGRLAPWLQHKLDQAPKEKTRLNLLVQDALARRTG